MTNAKTKRKKKAKQRLNEGARLREQRDNRKRKFEDVSASEQQILEDYDTHKTRKVHARTWHKPALPAAPKAQPLQLLEEGHLLAAEGLVLSQYMERGMQLEQDLISAKQSFEAAQRSRAFGSGELQHFLADLQGTVATATDLLLDAQN